MDAAVRAADPEAAVKASIELGPEGLTLAGWLHGLSETGRVHLIGAGKAAVSMGRACSQILGDRLGLSLLVVKDGYGGGGGPGVTVVEAGHPLPTEGGVAAARQIPDIVTASGAGDLVLAECPGAIVAGFATDGSGGTTGAAGAFADSSTHARATAISMAWQDYLDRNDSYSYFHALGDIINTGPTMTNAGDLYLGALLQDQL